MSYGFPMKLTLRDLFWLVLVVGLTLGWWGTYRARHVNLESAVELLYAAENDSKLWQNRAESLAKRVRQDGYQVKWSGRPDDHIIDIMSPEELRKGPATEADEPIAPSHDPPKESQ
jgi:hypothetical protein